VARHAFSGVRSHGSFERAPLNGFAPFAPPSRGLPRGGFPGRFRGVWLRRSPPRPSMREHRGPRGPYDRVHHMREHARATLLTLTPTFPSRPDSMRSDLPAGLPLLGLSKDRPSIVPNRRVRRPGSVSPRLPSGKNSQFVPRAVHVVSHHLDGFPLRPCRSVSPCCRSWGSPCFLPSRNGHPHRAIPALRSLPPADSDESGTSPFP